MNRLGYRHGRRGIYSMRNSVTCGLLCIKTQIAVPLKDIDVQVSIQGFAANVESTLLYRNEGSSTIEQTSFVFPIDEHSAVYRFEAEIDGRKITAECQEKEQARQTYKDAVARGSTAMLFEELDEMGDTFRCKLGNLPPNTDAKLTFSLVSELAVEPDGSVRFTLPTVLNPRYYSPDQSNTVDHDDNTIGTSGWMDTVDIVVNTAVYTLSFAADIKGSHVINKVEAEKDKLIVEFNQDRKSAKVSLSEKFTFDHDISLKIYYTDVYQPQAVLEKGKSDMVGLLKEDVLMLNFFPDLKEQELTSDGEFIFIIDRSGSMGCDNKIKNARDTLLLFLKSLPVGCYFNVIGFGNDYKVLFKGGSQEYTEESLAKALDLQRGMEADMGGTEILRPLQYVYEQPIIQGKPRQIFLMTDGDVGNPREVNELVGKNVQTTRVFAFGIGEGASTSLVRGIARAGKGKAEFIKGEERLQAKVMSILKSAMQPNVTGVVVEWELPPGVAAVNIPQAVPTIFSGDKLILYALLQGGEKESRNCAVKLAGFVDKTPFEYRIQFALAGSEDGLIDSAAPIHRLAAKAQIKEFEDKENVSNKPESLKSEIVLVSTASNVVSKYTAFVGFDEKHQPMEVAMDCSSDDEEEEHLNTIMCRARAPAPSHVLLSQNAVSGRTILRGGGPSPSALNTVTIQNAVCCSSMTGANVNIQKRTGATQWGGGSGTRPDAKVKRRARTCSPKIDVDLTDEVDEQKKTDPLLQLIDLQNFSGSWDLTDRFSEIIGAELKMLQDKIPVKEEKVWATAIAVAWLRKCCTSQKDEWEMIETKALRWLKKESLSMPLDEVLNAAEACLK